MKMTLVLMLTSLLLLMPAALFASPEGTPTRAGANLADTWLRCGGPLGGLGYDVRMHPDNPDTLFVTDAFAGVFKSSDGGATWQPSNNGITTVGGMSGDAIPVFCLTIDPNNPRTIWCGLQYTRGIFKSTNGGDSWVEKTAGIIESDGITIRGITIDPDNSDIVYAAGEISSWTWADSSITGREFDKTMGVIYKSINGGESWDEVWRDDNLARYVWIDPRDSQVLYASTGIFDREAANSDTTTNDPGGIGIIKSTNGGTDWVQKNNGLTNLYVGTLFLHPEDPDILLAGCSNNAYPTGSGVFLTTDGAESWTKVLDDGVQSVEFSVSEPNFAYAGNPGSIYQSTDGGWNWVETTPVTNFWGPPGIMAGFPIDFQVDPGFPERMFANNYGGGNFMTEDGGHTWTAASTGYTGAQVRNIAVAPYDPARIYAAARSGMFVSFNWGLEWIGLINWPAYGLEWNVVDIDPHNPLHMLAANNYTGAILESHDGAETWRVATPALPDGKAWRCFAFAPSDPLTIYGGTAAFLSAGQFDPVMAAVGIYKSTDGGIGWSPANDIVSQSAQVAELAVHPQFEWVVYAASTNQGLLKTTNGGLEWVAMNEGLPALPSVLTVAIDPANHEHLFAGLEIAGLYQSFDAGTTWQAVPVGLPAEANVTSIVFNPLDNDLIYLADQHSGVYRSVDGGATWNTVNDGLRTRAVNELAQSLDGQVLYAGTEGEGVFLLEGAGPPVGVGDPPPLRAAAELDQSYPNPFNPTTTIDFTLQKPTRVSLRIIDATGRLVRTLLDEPRNAGPHRLMWDGRDDAGRSVASGVYFYRLEGAGVDQTKQMVLVR